jgi:glyoxylase-like metal-dependent hydrolase (beta-lactamase superfamily II)
MFKTIEFGDVIIYQFPENKNLIGTNISFMKMGENQVMIDAGYSYITKEILDVVMEKQICICTHFHPDHYDGFRVFSHYLIANSSYQETLQIFETLSEEITPDKLIYREETLKLFDKEFTLIPCKGHSVDGLLVVIDEVLFVGDELMYTNDGRPILPYVASSIQNHINSLHTIKRLSTNKVIVPAHGSIITNQEFLQNDISMRLRYLYELGDKSVDINDPAYSYFENLKWHESNKLKK